MFSNYQLTKKQKREGGKILLAVAFLLLGSLTNKGYFSLACYFLAYVLVGFDVLKRAGENIINGQVFDENFLMAIATIGAIFLKEYKEAVFVMVFYKVGELFESVAVGTSRKSIQSLLDYAPDEARIIKGQEERLVDPEDVEIGDLILVYAGEKIPLDGKIVEGKSSLNLAFLTGESLPLDVKENDIVPSGAINLNGVLKIQVQKEYSDSTISKILDLIENSATKKSIIEGFITRFAKVYTPIVVIGALVLAFLPPIILGESFGIWAQRALIFLVVSCPCALVISVPLAFFGGIGKASKKGILIKGSNFLEALSLAETIVFDKTGTLTKGDFEIIQIQNYTEEKLEDLAGKIEGYSSHPIAKSITKTLGSDEKKEVSNIEEIQGQGLTATYKNQRMAAGNKKLMEKLGFSIREEGVQGTKVYIAKGQKLLGHIDLGDKIKEDAKSGLEKIKTLGIKNLVMLTGDKKKVGEKIAFDLGINEVYTELLPSEKVTIVEKLLGAKGKNKSLAYVGDGINDAPVLTRADVGIAMGALGSDVAIEASDIVLMDDKIEKISQAIEISKKTMAIARQNIVLALGVKFLVLFLSVFGKATMWMAIFADVGVLVLAILNSMRTYKD